MIYWTADWHINHANAIKYCGRTIYMNEEELSIYNLLKDKPMHEQKQFKISKESVDKMNQDIIYRCNERVKEEDTLFFVGDLGFKSGTGRGEGEPEKLQKYISQINCKNIIWIEGNHDYAGRNGFKTIIRKVIVHYGGMDICIVHDPKFADIRYKLNLVGHVHNNWLISRIEKGELFTNCYNVGVDMHNFYPIDFNKIMKNLTKGEKENEIT